MRRWLFGPLTAVLLVAGVVLPPLTAHADNGNGIDFWIRCNYSGISGTFDPIVDPGSTTTAHFHDFFGNTTVNPNSTPTTLQNAGIGATNCTTSTDTAAYWAPTLTLGPGETQTYGPAGFPCQTDAAGLRACHYANIRAYYSRFGEAGSGLANLPFGMETVGGDAQATGVQSQAQVEWACGGTSPEESHPYDCTPYINLAGDQDGVVMIINMPRCWNGLDPTNRGNFAYPTSGSTAPPCPSNFPTVLPVVNVRFHTGIVTPCPGSTCLPGNTQTPDFGFELANGTMMPWYQAHADFMNGWQYGDHGTGDKLGGIDDLVHDCLQLGLTCPINPHTSPVNNMPT